MGGWTGGFVSRRLRGWGVDLFACSLIHQRNPAGLMNCLLRWMTRDVSFPPPERSSWRPGVEAPDEWSTNHVEEWVIRRDEHTAGLYTARFTVGFTARERDSERNCGRLVTDQIASRQLFGWPESFAIGRARRAEGRFCRLRSRGWE